MRLISGETIYQGNKGGGGNPRTPVEQQDDLLSVAKLKMLLAISEGEIQGDLTAQQIYLNDTQLANDDGTYNFSGVVWDWRRGTQDQSYIQGMPEVDNELSVGVTVTQSAPWTRQFTNLSLDAVRIKLSLPVQYAYKDNGDMVGAVTQYAIDLSTDGGSWVNVVDSRFSGKTTSEYQRDHRIDLPDAATGWSVRVRRITPDSTSSKLVNAFKVFSFAEVLDSKLRYPNTALLYVEVDAAQFNGQAPKITCKPKGKLVRVPVTYDPVSRTYSGSWQGDFKYAYTNNPAWIFYDLVLDKIYGMGNRVDASMIDKWELYGIAQYCDEMVSNGAGGKEPRFTCNVFIQSQQDAYTVLKDIAAVFRGITFWGNSQIFVNADVPQVDASGNVDVDFVYHAANVVDGLFTYAGGSYKNRYSSCQVGWSDPLNHYSDTVEGVYDSELVKRYDVREMTLTAIGCTSQSEAHRRGRWAILSNAKDGTVSFGVGLDGYIPVPAEIIGVADPFRSGKQNGGRISAVNGKSIKLDRKADYGPGDRLVVNLPDGTAQTRTIASVSADKQTVAVATAFRLTPDAGAVWAIDSDTLAIQYFRVTSISANGDGTFTVAGVQHDPDKYRYIDDGVRIEPAPITVTPVNVLKAPQNILISEVSFIEQGLSVSAMQVTWDKTEGAINYVAQWRKDKGDWVSVSQTSAQGFSVRGIYTGVYDVRVRAVNAAEVSSPWGFAESTSLSGKAGRPGTPVNLRATENVVFAIDVTWAFPAGAGDTAYTEIQVATTADGQNPQLLAYVPYPGVSYQHGPMPAGVRRWYRARLVDKIGSAGDWTGFAEGASSVDASDILSYLTDQITATELSKDLLSDINSKATTEAVESAISEAKAESEKNISEARREAGELAAAAKSDAISQASMQIADAKALLSEQLAAEAGARADALLNEKNERVADVSQVQTLIQNTGESLSQQISQVAAGSGEQFDSLKIWYFDASAEGWSGNGTPSVTSDGWLRPASHSSDPYIVSPSGLSADAGAYRFIKMRIKKVGTPKWNGDVRWVSSGQGFNNTRLFNVAEPVYDAAGVATLTVHDIPWNSSGIIDRIRIDLTSNQDDSNYMLVDWIALGRPTPGAGMAALQDEATARVNADAAEAASRNTLAVQLRGAYDGNDLAKVSSGLIYQEQQARVTADRAEVTARQSLEAKVADSVTGINRSLDALSTQDKAMASDITGLKSSIGDKADSSALQALRSTVTQQGEDITSAGSKITSLQNGLATTNSNVSKKADQSSLQALQGTVSKQGNDISSANSSITSLESSVSSTNKEVAKKADAAALSALQNTVTQQGNDISSQSSSITQLSNTLANVTVGGVNLIKNSGDMTGWTNRTDERYRGNAVLSVTGIDGSSKDLYTAAIDGPVDGSEYTYSFWAKSDTDGQKMTAFFYNPNTTTGAETSQGATSASSDGRAVIVLTTEWARYWVRWKQTPATGTKRLIMGRIESGSAGKTVYFSSPKFERGNTATDWSPAPGDMASSEAVSLLSSKVTGVDGQVSAQAKQITDLTAAIGDNRAEATSILEATLTNALASSEETDRQLVSFGKSTASISRLQKTVADNESATAQSFASVESRIEESSSSISQLQKTVTDNQSATAQSISLVQSSIGNVSAGVQQNTKSITQLDGRVSAQYTVKVAVDSNGRQYAAGMGIGVENSPEGMQAQVLFLADRFAVMSQVGAAPQAFFAIQNGQTIIQSAFIGNATVTNAKIGDYIQSNNYSSGKTGWRIDKSGSAEFSGVTVRGDIYASRGELNNVTINETCVIKGTLSASRINGPLMQSKSFSFVQTNTNASSTVYWDGTAGRGDVPMTLSGTVWRFRNNLQTASRLEVAGQVIYPTANPTISGGEMTVYSFSVDIGTSAAAIQFFAGALNQSQGQNCVWSAQLFASPTANQFHT